MPYHEQVEEISDFTDRALVSRELKSYELPERLRWLRGHSKAGFLPTSRDEANAAFRIIFHVAERNQTAVDELERVRMTRLMQLGDGDLVAQADSSVRAVVRDRAAFARQASRDGRWLKTAQAQLAGDAANIHLYPHAASYFSGVPLYEGVGQLVRYLDVDSLVDSGREPDGFKVGAKLADGKQRNVVDPYTANQPSTEMSRHITSELETIGMDDLSVKLGMAVANEDRRLAFWTGQMAEALQDSTAHVIAQALLQDVNRR